ncbi:MAG: efflux RND transporter periplasmic adaptor subunit [Planctomycetes bacterium]|nr:efflux RND transporter periplasmic adaptor subunit [Planctomycetota bacterium]
MTPVGRARAFARSRWLSLAAVATVGVAAVFAHEGHAPLPTKGAVADPETGSLLLTADARSAVDVDTAVVESRPVEDKVLAYATIAAPWRSHGYVTAQLPGRVTRVAVTPGQAVKAGDVLAEVESLDLDTLQLELASAQNDIALSDKLVTELRKSADQGVVSGQTVIDAESTLAQHRNALAVARAKWLTLGLPPEGLDELSRTRKPVAGLTLPVRAPVSGVVIHAEVTAGKVVDTTEHLAEVIDLSTVSVRVGVLEKDLGRVLVGQAVELHLVAYPSEVFRIRVQARSLFLDPVTNVAAVWAELANPPGSEPRFQPGMAGQAYVVVSDGKARPTVPSAAVLREGAERFVLVEEASAAGASEYRKKSVVVGRESGGRTEVLGGGIFPGDRVVTRGGHELAPFFAPTVLRLSPEAERTIGLKVEPATLRVVDEVLTLDGVVELPPAKRGFAASQIAGTIQTIRADRGQLVKPGDVVAEVYSPELLTMQQELLKTHLEAALAETTLASLRKIPGAAAQTLWKLESQLNGLRSRGDGLRRKLLTAGLTPDHVERLLTKNEMLSAVPVRSPVAGVVVNFDKVLGQAVAAHEPLFEVHDVSAPWVRGFASERDLGSVSLGQSVRVRLVADPAFVGTGKVVRSSRTVGADTRSLAVWVELDGGLPGGLLNNQLATVTVVRGSRPPAVAVPKSAVVADGSAAFVFVRSPDGVFARRAVDLGHSDDRFVAVTRGLSAGEPVAVAGAAELMTAHASLR